jgi:hypothetical protein
VKGKMGKIGLQGAKGDTGIQGESGAQGIQGVQGTPGDTGPQGTPGDTGPQGTPGEIASPNLNKYRAVSLTGDIWLLEDVGGAMNYSINGSSLGYFTYTLFDTTYTTYTTSGGGVLGMVLIPQESILLNVSEGGIQNMVSGVAVIDFPTNVILNNTDHDYNHMEALVVPNTKIDESYGTSTIDNSSTLTISSNTLHPFQTFGSTQDELAIILRNFNISSDGTYLSDSNLPLTCFGSTQCSLYCVSSTSGMLHIKYLMLLI